MCQGLRKQTEPNINVVLAEVVSQSKCAALGQAEGPSSLFLQLKPQPGGRGMWCRVHRHVTSILASSSMTLEG